MKRVPASVLIRNLVLVLLYTGLGMIGLRLAATGGGYAAPVWLPTGFAVAAVQVWGKRMLPGVWIGAFLTNFFVRPELALRNFILASVIATGNACEAWLVNFLLRRSRFSQDFSRLSDVTGFVTASILGPIASATIGVTTVGIAYPEISFSGASASWLTWWVGDVLGALVFSPILITVIGEKPKHSDPPVQLGRTFFPVLLVALSYYPSRFLFPLDKLNLFFGFALYSCLIWCALTLPIRKLFFLMCAGCLVTVARAYLGLGLFGTGDIVQRLALLQFFLGCISVTMMLLSAAVSERIRASDLAHERERALMRAEKMSALGEMTSGIAHEISNPLLVIYGKTDQALAMVGSGKERAENLVPILEKIDSMARRIDQIIKSVRFYSRNAELDPFKVYPLRSILDDTTELCHDQFKKHEVQLIIDPVPDNVVLECKPVLIAQVLLNLLNNAHAAVIDGPAKWVRVSMKAGDKEIEISVVDGGYGISPGIREEIFRPFFTTKTAGRGTGLGLSVSRNIVESHHGTIYLDSASPHTRFVVTLPIRQPRASS